MLVPNDLGGGGADPGFQGCPIGLSQRDQWGIHSEGGEPGVQPRYGTRLAS